MSYGTRGTKLKLNRELEVKEVVVFYHHVKAAAMLGKFGLRILKAHDILVDLTWSTACDFMWFSIASTRSEKVMNEITWMQCLVQIEKLTNSWNLKLNTGKKVMMRMVKEPLSCFETDFTLHVSLLPASFSISIPCPSICSWVHLCTASSRGSVTCMCHCWTGCMSTTPLNTLVASSCARTTAPTKLSSSRCKPSTLPCVKTVGGEAEKVEEKMRWEGEEGVGGKSQEERGKQRWRTGRLGLSREESGVIKRCLSWQ